MKIKEGTKNKLVITVDSCENCYCYEPGGSRIEYDGYILEEASSSECTHPAREKTCRIEWPDTLHKTCPLRTRDLVITLGK
jgi:hypothetical protein